MADQNIASKLPRLAIVTDVPVERSWGGSLLLHRLFSNYPPGKLLIVNSRIYRSWGPEQRLRGVEYRTLDYSIPRYVQTRINPLGPWQQTRRMNSVCRAVTNQIGAFQPDAIVTVAHDYLWKCAAQEAITREIPLHLIVHDDWQSMVNSRRQGVTARIANSLANRDFGPVYRMAASRLCIGPGMEETYRDRYGATGEVIYPNRGDDSPHPRVRVGRRAPGGPPVAAFAGALHTEGVVELLLRLAQILSEIQGRLDIYTSSDEASLASRGFLPPYVRFKGFHPPTELAERIADSADFLILPASFRAEERTLVSTLFPSKLADYTAIGIPILIWGPDYSSAVRWGRENPESVVIETEPVGPEVRRAAELLATNHHESAKLAASGVACGKRDFSLAEAQSRLYSALIRSVSSL